MDELPRLCVFAEVKQRQEHVNYEVNDVERECAGGDLEHLPAVVGEPPLVILTIRLWLLAVGAH